MKAMNPFFKKLILCHCVVWNFVQAQPDLPGCEWTTFVFDEGNVSSEGCLVDGKPEGVWLNYHPTGALKSEGARKDHLLDGTWRFYRIDGSLERQVDYAEDVRNGTDCTFDETGKICLEETPWVAGIRNGLKIIRFADGQTQLEIPLVEGLENGRGQEFSADGRLISFLDYRDGFLRSLEVFNRLDSQGKKHGVWVTFKDDNHRIKQEEGPWRHGVKHGVFKYYDKFGNLERMVQFENGEPLSEDNEAAMLLDIRRTYHENGAVQSVGSFNEGVKQGVFRMYDETGVLVDGEIYQAGRLVASGVTNPAGDREGEWVLYFPSGEVQARGGYADGLREGEWTFFYESGQTAQIGSYRAGELHGSWTWYFESGKVHRRERYRNGKKDGLFEEFDEQGNTLLRGEYISGYRNGAWIYEVNDHKEEGEYVDGEWNGEWVHTYDNNQKRFQGSFNFGQPEGKHETWYRSGRTQWSGRYDGGVRDGKWFFYDEDGLLEATLQYDLGVLTRINGNKVSESMPSD